MKIQMKFLLLILTLTLLLSFASCQPAAEPAPTATSAPTEVPPTDTPVPPTETPAPTDIPPTETPAIKYGDSDHFVDVGNSRRFYSLYIPPGLAVEEAVPVVFAFHGNFKDARKMRLMTGFNDIADRDGFVAVYPNGVEMSWNMYPSAHGYAAQNNIDDIGFVKAILSDLESMLELDPNRIYATGYSMGAGMVYRLACEMSDTIAAVASVSGGMGPLDCEPGRPVAVLEIHGLADELVPFYGGGPRRYPPVQNTIDIWVEINGCAKPTTQKDENAGTTHTTYSLCQDDSAVELVAVEGMGHGWADFASETIWTFFITHPMP